MNGFRLLFDCYITPGKINCQDDFRDFSSHPENAFGVILNLFCFIKNPQFLSLLHENFQVERLL